MHDVLLVHGASIEPAPFLQAIEAATGRGVISAVDGALERELLDRGFAAVVIAPDASDWAALDVLAQALVTTRRVVLFADVGVEQSIGDVIVMPSFASPKELARYLSSRGSDETPPPTTKSTLDVVRQLAELLGASVRLEVHEGHQIVGEVRVYRGETWSVRDPEGRGPPALQRLTTKPASRIGVSKLGRSLGSRDMRAAHGTAMQWPAIDLEGGGLRPVSTGPHRPDAPASSQPDVGTGPKHPAIDSQTGDRLPREALVEDILSGGPTLRETPAVGGPKVEASRLDEDGGQTIEDLDAQDLLDEPE